MIVIQAFGSRWAGIWLRCRQLFLLVLVLGGQPAPTAWAGPGADLIKIGINNLQIQYSNDESEGIGSGVSDNTFSIRRAEIYAKGKLNAQVTYYVESDLAVKDNPLRSAYIDFSPSPKFSLRLGQFRIPFGIEIQTASRHLPLINRMLITNPNNEQASSKGITSIPSGLIQERDIGVRVSDGVRPLSYAIAIVNGSGSNTPDENNVKDLVGRLALSPIRRLTLGSSAYFGKNSKDTRRERVGSDVEFRPLETFLARGELVTGRDGDTKLAGYYLLVSYQCAPNIESALRHEGLDPDTHQPGDEIRRTTVGISYAFSGGIRSQLNYEWRKDRAKPNLENMALAQLQISF